MTINNPNMIPAKTVNIELKALAVEDTLSKITVMISEEFLLI